MSELDHDHALNQSINALSDALQSGRFVRMRRLLAGLHPAETAHLLESLPPNERKICWPLINPDLRGEVLSYIGEEVRTDLMTDMDTADLINATEDLDTDDIADILQDLPDHVVHEILRAMDIQHRRRVEAVLAYDEDSAGGLMNTDVTTVRLSAVVTAGPASVTPAFGSGGSRGESSGGAHRPGSAPDAPVGGWPSRNCCRARIAW